MEGKWSNVDEVLHLKRFVRYLNLFIPRVRHMNLCWRENRVGDPLGMDRGIGKDGRTGSHLGLEE